MPALALPAFWGAITAGAAGAAGIVGAKISSGAAQDAASTTGAAATHAADLQSQATQQALDFQKEQAENAFQNNEASRQGNYGQFAAQQTRLKSVGEALGIPNAGGMEIPAYVPGVDPRISGAPPSVGQPAGAPATASGSVPPLTALSNPSAWMSLVGNPTQLSAWVQQGLGPNANPSLVNYYVGKIQGQPGANPTEQAGSANYWLQKLQSDPSVTGAPPASSSASAGSVGSYLTPYAPVPVAPGLTAPAAGSVGSYL